MVSPEIVVDEDSSPFVWKRVGMVFGAANRKLNREQARDEVYRSSACAQVITSGLSYRGPRMIKRDQSSLDGKPR
jgi:hypothetical protein